MKGQLLKLLSQKKRGEQKTFFAIPLTGAAASVLVLILLCAVAWAFFMGYMVGRGQNPESSLAKLTGIRRETAHEANSLEPQSEQAVDADRNIQPEAFKADESIPFQKPAGEQSLAWPDSPVKAADNAAAASQDKTGKTSASSQSAKKVQPDKKSLPLFDFTYQTAAFRNARDADNLREKLEKSGIRCKTRKSGKVFLVVANFRGSEKDAQLLIGKLAGLKLGKPLLLSKKQAASSGSKKR